MYAALHQAGRGHNIRLIQLAWATLALVVAGVVLTAAPAFAHAIVRSTSPSEGETVLTAPDRVVVEFNEPVEASFGSLRVFDGAGRRVDEGAATLGGGDATAVAVSLVPDPPDGTYTVSWRVVSADGHPIEEAFVFHIGAPGSHPEGVAEQILAGESGAGVVEAVLLRTARWAGFASLFLLIGGVLFTVGIWRRTDASRHPEIDSIFRRRCRRLLAGAWFTLLGASLAAFVFQGAVAANVPLREALSPLVLREVLTTRFGQVTLLRVLLLTFAAAMWHVSSRAEVAQPQLTRSVGAAAARPTSRQPIIAAGIVAVVGLAVTPGLAGHAGTTPPVVANLFADAVHVLAGAAWFGGLVLLVAATFPAVASVPHEDRGRLAAPVVARFSDTAMVAVAALVVTGLFRAWLEVRTLDALVAEPYGVSLLVKLAVFLPLLALGAVNIRWLKPRLQQAAAAGTDPTRALSLLRRTVAAEVALVVVVLAVTAVLVNIAPARVTAMPAGPFSEDLTLGDHEVRITVEPGRVGENTVGVLLPHAAHDLPFEAVEVRFFMPEGDIGPLVAEAADEGDRYVVRGHQLSVPGEWHLEIVAATGRFTEASATVTVRVDR